jgi:hypothetical protein
MGAASRLVTGGAPSDRRPDRSVITDTSARRRPTLDDLDGSIARRAAKNPRYPDKLQAEVRRQRLIAALVAERKANHLTQALVAAEMNVSQSVGALLFASSRWSPS